jgi:hypothetical protein
MRREDQDMAQQLEAHPEIIGPPAYASPDPTTNTGRLVPIEDHPLELSEDYGASVPTPAEVTATIPGFGDAADGGSAHTSVPDDLDLVTQDELKEMAKARDLAVSGTKAELADRIKEYDEHPPDDNADEGDEDNK